MCATEVAKLSNLLVSCIFHITKVIMKEQFTNKFDSQDSKLPRIQESYLLSLVLH